MQTIRDYMRKLMALIQRTQPTSTGSGQLGSQGLAIKRSSIVYMPIEEFRGMYGHCAAFANSHEVIGWLIGDVFFDGSIEYCWIFHSITGGNEATPVSAKFSREGIAQTMHELTEFQRNGLMCPLDKGVVSERVCGSCGYDLRNARIVGWYHSHPNLSPFMSGTDIQTHETYFNFECGVAIVIDPVLQEYRIWQTRKTLVEEVVLFQPIKKGESIWSYGLATRLRTLLTDKNGFLDGIKKCWRTHAYY